MRTKVETEAIYKPRNTGGGQQTTSREEKPGTGYEAVNLADTLTQASGLGGRKRHINRSDFHGPGTLAKLGSGQ